MIENLDVYYSIAPSLILGGGALLGGIAGGMLNKSSTESANKASSASTREQMIFQREEAEKARKYQTEMSNTAYQRAMADMKMAGLNPMLAFQQGGASTPASPSPSGSSYQAQVSRHGDIIGESAPKAIQSGLASMQFRNYQEQNKLLGEQVQQTLAHTQQTSAQTRNLELTNALQDGIVKTILSSPELLQSAAASQAGVPDKIRYVEHGKGYLQRLENSSFWQKLTNSVGSAEERQRRLKEERAATAARAAASRAKMAKPFKDTAIDAAIKWQKGKNWLRDVFTRGKPIYTPKR